MTDFETHPVGEIARLEAYLARRRKSSQTDFEDIHCYDAGCATEAVLLASDIEVLIAAHTRANAATAAAYEVAAREGDDFMRVALDDETDPDFLTGNARGMYFCARQYQRDIRALATPDQQSALDRLIAEAEARVWKRAMQAVDALPEAQSPDVNVGVANAYAAILSASKKGGAA